MKNNDPTTATTRLRLDPDERHEQILRAALDAFHTKGYGQTSVRDLAESVGMSIAGMYHYFATKEDLLFAIIDTSVNRLLTALTAARDSATDPEARLRAMLAATIRIVVENRAEIRILIDNADKLPTKRQEQIRLKRREGLLMVRREIEVLQARGQLKKLDVNVATFALNGMANWIYYWYSAEDAITPLELTEQLAEIFFRGIFKSGSTARPTRGKKKLLKEKRK